MVPGRSLWEILDIVRGSRDVHSASTLRTLDNGVFEIGVGKCYAAPVSLGPLYDPDSKKTCKQR